MSVALDEVLEAMNHLSPDELLLVQEQLQSQLQTASKLNNLEKGRVNIPGSYRPTPEQIEALLAAMFTPEQRREIDAVDLTKLPTNLPSVTEMISEDREDRF